MALVGVRTILVPVIDGQPLSGFEEISRFLVGSICSRSSLRDTKGGGNSSAPFLNAQHISSKKRRVLGLTSGKRIERLSASSSRLDCPFLPDAVLARLRHDEDG